MLKIFKNTIYIRLKADEIYLQHIESGNELTLPPEIAIDSVDGKKILVTVGQEAAVAKKLKPTIEVFNGFKHPRTLIADFVIAEQTLKFCIRKLLMNSLFSISPIIIFQPLEKDEGGYTQVEERAFQELCERAGARKTYIKIGARLTNDELLRISNGQ